MDLDGGAMPRIPSDPDEPFETARSISQTGLGVALLGLDEQSNLVRVQFADGVASPLYTEDRTVFDPIAYEAWRKQYPYQYGFIDEPRRDAGGRRLREVDLGGFKQTLERIGVSYLPPQRTVLVLDTNLQVLPPNILKVGDDLAARSRAMAIAPSLSWLRHAASRRDRAAGPSLAWISTAAAHEGLPTLGLMAERLEPALQAHGIPLDRGAIQPERLKGAELAIVGAHGGIHTAGEPLLPKRGGRRPPSDRDAGRLPPAWRVPRSRFYSSVRGGGWTRHPMGEPLSGCRVDYLMKAVPRWSDHLGRSTRAFHLTGCRLFSRPGKQACPWSTRTSTLTTLLGGRWGMAQSYVSRDERLWRSAGPERDRISTHPGRCATEDGFRPSCSLLAAEKSNFGESRNRPSQRPQRARAPRPTPPARSAGSPRPSGTPHPPAPRRPRGSAGFPRRSSG